MDQLEPSFPIVYRDASYHSYLYVLQDLTDVQQNIEDNEIWFEEYEAWDYKGYPLELQIQKARDPRERLRIIVREDRSRIDSNELYGMIREYAELNGVSSKENEYETMHAFYMRIESALDERRWSNRPWWRHVLGLPNAKSAKSVTKAAERST